MEHLTALLSILLTNHSSQTSKEQLPKFEGVAATILLKSGLKKFMPTEALLVFIRWLSKKINGLNVSDCDSVEGLLLENDEKIKTFPTEIQFEIAQFRVEILSQKQKNSNSPPFFGKVLQAKYGSFTDLLTSWTARLNCVHLAKLVGHLKEITAEKKKLYEFEQEAMSQIFVFMWSRYEKYFFSNVEKIEAHQYAWKLFSQIIRAYKTSAAALPLSQTYQAMLMRARDTLIQTLPTVKELFSILGERASIDTNVHLVTESLSDYQWGIKRLLDTMIEQGVTWLGESGVAFLWVGFGSFARKELLPYSDLEFGLFIEKDLSPSKRAYADAYFFGLLSWFQFCMVGLGETNEQLTSLPNGFRFDNKLSVKLQDPNSDPFYGTPKEIFDKNFVKAWKTDPAAQSETLHCLLSVSSFSGNATGEVLLKDYQALVQSWLEKKNPEKTNADLLYQHCLTSKEGHLKQLSSTTRPKFEELRDNGFSVKDLYLAPLSHLLQDLYYKTQHSKSQMGKSTLQIVRLLTRQLDPVAQNALSLLYMMCLVLRIRAQQQHRQQLSPEYITLSREAQEEIFNRKKSSTIETDMLSQLARTYQKPNFFCIFSECSKNLINYFSQIELFLIPMLKKILINIESLAPCSASYFLDFVQIYLKKDRKIRPITKNNQLIIEAGFSYLLTHEAATEKYYVDFYQQLFPEEAVYFFVTLLRNCRMKPRDKILKATLLEINKLSKIPLQNGFCVWRGMQRQEWLSVVQGQLGEKMPNPEITGVRKALDSNQILLYCAQLDQPEDSRMLAYYLLGEIFTQALFAQDPKTQQWHLKERPDFSADFCHHKVLPVPHEGKPVFWVKILPENAANERLDEEWMALLTGDGGTASLEAKLMIPVQKILDHAINPKKKSYITMPILLISHVPGTTLSRTDILRFPYKLNLITDYAWTWSFLRVLFVTPEDDRGEDYKMVPMHQGTYALVRIDRERIFHAMTYEKTVFSVKLSHTPIVKSILLCLDLMKTQPLDKKLLRHLCCLDPEQVVERFLHFSEQLSERYQRLFSLDEAKRHLTEPDALLSYILQPHYFSGREITFSTTALLGVGVRENLYCELLTRLSAVKTFICSRKIGAPIFAESFMKMFGAPLADFYNVLFEKIPVDSEHPEKAELRYSNLSVVREEYEETPEGYRKTTHSAMVAYSSLHAAHDERRNFSLEDGIKIFQNQPGFPSVASARWQLEKEKKQIKDIMSVDTLVQAWENKGIFDKHFIKKLSQLSSFQRLALIDALSMYRYEVLKCNNEDKQAEHLLAIMQDVLATIKLVRFNLSRYPVLSTDGILFRITKNCFETLLILKIVCFDQITPLGLNSAIGRCVQLRSLTLENLPWEELILTPIVPFFVFLPNLERFVIRRAMQLRLIKTEFSGLGEMKLFCCPKLTHEGLKNALPKPERLFKFNAKKTGLVYEAILHKFPFVCTKNLSFLTDAYAEALRDNLSAQCNHFAYQSEEKNVLKRVKLLKIVENKLLKWAAMGAYHSDDAFSKLNEVFNKENCPLIFSPEYELKVHTSHGLRESREHLLAWLGNRNCQKVLVEYCPVRLNNADALSDWGVYAFSPKKRIAHSYIMKDSLLYSLLDGESSGKLQEMRTLLSRYSPFGEKIVFAMDKKPSQEMLSRDQISFFKAVIISDNNTLVDASVSPIPGFFNPNQFF